MPHPKQWLQVAILGLTGVYFVYVAASGNVTNYIAERFIWLTWLAALLLIALAVAAAIALLDAEDHDHAGHDHQHHHHPASAPTSWAWIGLMVVALPVVLGVFVPSEPLRTDAIEDQSAAELMSIEVSETSRVTIPPLERNIIDWLREFNQADDLTVFEDEPADIIGFVYRNPDLDQVTQFMVVRFTVSCCVADAQSIGLVVEWPEAATLTEDAWVRVRGTFAVDDLNDSGLPILVAFDGVDGIEFVEQPAHPYLYP